MKRSSENSFKTRSLFTILVIAFALLQPLTAALSQEKQIVNTITGPDGQRHTLTEGHATFVSHGDSIVDKFVTHPEGDSRIIVQFASPPLSSLRASGRIPFPGEQEELRTQIHAEQDLFLSDLARIERMIDIDTGEPYPRDGRLHFVYKKVFNGVSLTAKQAVTAEIQSLPYVRKVHADETVYALIDQSIGIIGANDIWSGYNITGEGIVVGILDTGIDYMHPDLGGGLGPDYKVMGGYDFVNGNNDPMDDHRHGTHVAGIVAANGQLQGVAPDARLVGYKVLDHEGYGYASWIIAGIEQSVIDGVDILNVSLGGPGSPDDPMSQAIDNASAAGVVCVVAAGNSGPGYYTLGSPGVAKRALTVGATYLNDDIASFSSKGPVNQTHDIKPDVMAPGVQINAPVLNAGYQQMSGTSMAAPHVAGAAALLLAEYPDLTPDQLKSIFSQSATDMGLNIWSQGAGRVDLPNAFELPDVLISPSMLSFGLTDLTQESWTSSETINVSSLKDIDQWVTLSLDDGFPEGAGVSITPAEFLLQAGETEPVEITLAVNTQTVPFSDTDFPSYVASLNVETDAYETNIPLTFVKSPVLHIYLDESPYFIYVFGQGPRMYAGYNQEETFPLPPGHYTVYIQYDDFLTSLIFENVPIEGYHEMHLSKQDAKNHVEIVAPDINGNPVNTKISIDQFRFHDVDRTISIISPNPLNKNRYFTDFDSTRWIWGGSSDCSEGARTMYFIGGALEECLSDTIFSYEPNELMHLKLDYKNASDEHDLFSFGTPIIGGWQLGSWNSFAPPLTHPFRQDLYFSPEFKPGPRLFASYVESYAHTGSPIDPIYTNPLYKTSQIWFNKQDQPMLSSFDYIPVGTWPINAIPVKGETVSMDLAPPSWNGKFYHQEGNQLLMTNFYGLFQLQQKGTFKGDQLQYSLYRDGALAGSGDFFEDYPFFDTGFMFVWVDFEPGGYVLEIDYDHYAIQGVDGTATARMGFNTSTGEGFIPRLSAFNISYEDAYYTDIIGTGEEGIIEFVAEIYEPFIDGAEITLEYRAESDTDWHPMDIAEDEGHYSTYIPETLPLGYISLRIQMVDNLGNFLDYTLEPAFMHTEVGDAVVDLYSGVLDIYQNSAVIHSEVTEDGGSAVTDRGVVWCTSEYPDLNNHLGVTSDGKGLGRFISHVSGMESNTTYYARAYATNSLGVAYSEPFMLDQIPDCLPPKALYAESVTQTSAMIGWTEAGEAQLWDIVYGYEGFDPDTEGYMASAADIPYQLEDLQHSAVYEFYVRSHCDDVSSAWSEPASFTTECDTPVFVFHTPDEGQTFNITTDSTIPYSYYFFGCDWVVARLFIADDSQQHHVKYISVSASGFYEDVFEAFETLPGGTYRFRLRYTYDEQQYMLESNEFEIINDNTHVKLTRPHAGKYFVAGYPLAIRWNALNIPFVNIDYSLDLGQSWSTAAHNVASPDGYAIYGQNAFNWLIPAHIEGVHPESLIRIASTDNPDLSSISAPFIISDNLPVNIIAPTAESLIEINEDMEIIVEVLNPSIINVFLGNKEGFVDHIAKTGTASTLDQLRGMPDDGNIYHYTGEAVIVAMDDYRNRKFLQDETAAIMIDDYPGVITTNYDLYDVITNVAGQISILTNMVQLQPTQNTAEAIDNRPADPVVFSLDAVTPDDQARLIRFNGVQFADIDTDEVFETGINYTIYHGSNEFVVRTDFWEADYIGEPVPHGMVDIAGVILQHQEALQLVPRFASDIQESDIHPYTVTFHVDLSLAIEHDILKGFDPYEHHIMITGEMFDWTEPFPSHEDMVLEQIGSDPVTYAITLSLPAGVYAYKYFSDLIGFGWGGGEWDGGNDRMVEVTGEMDVYDHFGFTDDNMPVSDTGSVSLTISPNPAQHTINGKDDGSANEISLMDIHGQVISFTYNTSGLIVDEEYYVYVYHENSAMEIPGEFFTISGVLYELSLSVAPPETGDVIGAGLYAENEEIIISAVPHAGYQFSHWTGDIEYIDNPNAAVATVVMPPQEISLTANFQIITHVVINASAGEGGSIDPEGAVTVDYGTDQSFTIAADTGYLPYELFVDGVDVGPHDNYTFVHAEQDHTIHATFTPRTHTLSYTAGENGTLSGETTQVVQHGHDGSPVEAIPDEGYRFTQWNDGVTDNPRTDTGVTDDLNVTAHFSINIYTITAVPNDEDFGSVTGAGDYEHFENVTLTATPETGYHFVNWTEDGDIVMDSDAPAGDVYTFMAKENRDLVTNFLFTTYNLTFQVVDADNGQEIIDAMITLNDYQYNAGVYEFEGFPPGLYAYTINHEQYFEVNGEAELENEDTHVMVELKVDDTSIHDTEQLSVRVFPNPASSTLHVEANLQMTDIHLIDLLGQQILSATMEAEQYELNVTGLQTGIYFLQVTTEIGVQTLWVQIIN